MALYTLHDLLVTHPTPTIPPGAFESIHGQQTEPSEIEDGQFEQIGVGDLIELLEITIRSSFFPRVRYEDCDIAGRSKIDAAAHLHLDPVVACVNGTRIPSSPVVYLEGGLCVACFEFKLKDYPFPHVEDPRDSFSVVAFMNPGSLDLRALSDDFLHAAPLRSKIISLIKHYDRRYVIITDTLTAVAVRFGHMPWDSKLCYTPFVDLQQEPLRLIVASYLYGGLREEAVHQSSSYRSSFAKPVGALDQEERRLLTYEDAMTQWKQKSDIDWYTACNDPNHRTLVSRWMKDTLVNHQGKVFVSRGDVLKMTPFAYQRRYPPLRAVYAKVPLPDSTAFLLEDKRRNAFLEAFGSRLEGAKEAEIRVLKELDSSNLMDGTSFACELVSIDGDSVLAGPKLLIKIFDDRRMGDPGRSSGDHQWFADSVWTQSDNLVALEDASYRRLDHAQGSMLPYYYGAHEVVLPDGIRCWAILTELVQGYNPQSLPQSVKDAIKVDVIEYVRHVLRVFQFSDVSKPLWRFGDIRINFTSETSADEASRRLVCTTVSLWRAAFSTLDGPHEPTDNHAELQALLGTAFGEDIVFDRFAEREPWDFYANYMNQYTGIEWKPEDYDSRYYAVDMFPRRSM
ncbi:hypothetical protein FRB90_012820 [Tulasnella sp. 427]|nr:hypothetical protein FRB90_012820 [Tulasnella sp. 427]